MWKRVDVLGRGCRSGDEPAETEMMGGIGMDGPQTDGNNGLSGRFSLKKLGTTLRVSFSHLGCRNIAVVCTMSFYQTQINLFVKNA